ncbi:thiamine-phosphate kinase [Parachitinimonas caeni]|uniref:Thiamine-monophosphate kinase n=1 Tax=Parachitinimonas caeni TaxID=3031301 RepID=A0ABT7DTP0_9NEIS|nr:thiamine-phosphate kinase [Parachitinimonas caeni]MDK2123452.1 thiamine-phosphate kinase [Parachitinimonas caeni]
MTEFELIERYFRRPTTSALLGVGDDCALLEVPAGEALAVSADTLVEGRHFFADVDPRALGHKCLAVNLSDLAAMGATPRWFTLCLTLPAANESWLADFAAGLLALADQQRIALVGGDTTRGPLSISIQVMGSLPAGQALRRDQARPDDDIWLSGEIGAAALAVGARYGKYRLPASVARGCEQRLDWPEPRLALGLALRGIARCGLDISDGLVADLGHICKASGLGAELDWNCLPHALASASELDLPTIEQAVLAGGDDYELCFTAAPAQRSVIEALAPALGLRLSRIGRMVPGRDVQVFRAGQAIRPALRGFDHFGQS